jgi:hypothetical protein
MKGMTNQWDLADVDNDTQGDEEAIMQKKNQPSKRL